MGHWNFVHFMCSIYLTTILLLPETCTASIERIGQIGLDKDGFHGSQMNFIDKEGIFLLSNNLKFGFGFNPTKDVTLFLLNIIHMDSAKVIWSANKGSLVKNSDEFNFDKDGNAYLESGGNVVWSTNTANKGVSSMELQDSGNLVLLGDDKKVIWESFSHPTDTLLSNQDFKEGMKLVSDVNSNNVFYFLEIKNGDMILYADYETPQPYWSIGKEKRKTKDKDGGKVAKATLDANSWRFLDQNDVLQEQFTFSQDTNVNYTWIAVLDSDGYITFSNLQKSGPSIQSTTKIPEGFCDTPEACDPYVTCSDEKCHQCPSSLFSTNCKTGINTSPCDHSAVLPKLVSLGDGIGYFAIDFVTPYETKINLSDCKSFCDKSCSCLAVFFKNSTGDCFLFDKVGSLQDSDADSGFLSFVKVSTNGDSDANTGGSESSKKHVFPVIVIIAMCTLFVIGGLVYGGFRFYQKKKEVPESLHENSDEDNFFENISGMPIRFSYKDLQSATNNFEVKLGQGGFGSVYQGTLPDGSQIAVKKLESIGQGKKEFRAEVSIIASIHHQHLVKLRGFCTEGTHRLLAYEFMANGSLEKWIFKSKKENFMLDWETRYNIALGTAKGLAYLHEDCDVKIVHCDIKPENVLLDDNYHAKVSDFGLAKLMTREQSHVFTTLRGTRGYLAPEWITNYAISEKSDVYSYGMVLLEIIGGRKNFDPSESSEKSHFPSYAFKMMEEGKLKDILDSNIKFEEHDEKVMMAIKVALWCIQEDMSQRPPMSKVVQMLEGNCVVPAPPTSSQLGGRLYSSFFKSISEEGTSSGPSDCNSDAYISAVRLSGPR